MASDLVRVQTAALRLDVHPDMVRKLARTGQIRAVRIGRAVRIPEEDIARLEAEGTDSGGSRCPGVHI